jgi:hypothetical protein
MVGDSSESLGSGLLLGLLGGGSGYAEYRKLRGSSKNGHGNQRDLYD